MELDSIIYFLFVAPIDFADVLPHFGYLLAKLSLCDG